MILGNNRAFKQGRDVLRHLVLSVSGVSRGGQEPSEDHNARAWMGAASQGVEAGVPELLEGYAVAPLADEREKTDVGVTEICLR